MRCLIIDDDESPRGLMQRIVSGSGHRVLAVGALREAVEALKEQSFDVALVDMEMPDASGETVIQMLRSVLPEIRILVVSAFGDRRRVLAALDAGADGYLLKDELSESLGESLQEVRAGHTPLSPRVARIILRQLRFRRLAEGTDGGQKTAPGVNVARIRRD